MEIQHFSHHHKLTFEEVGKEDNPERCYGCGSFFHGPAYTCKKCPGFFFHKSCTELPREIKNHSFHQDHPLKLYPVDSFVCDGCGEFCTSLAYSCGLCLFTLDVRCATLDQELAKSTAQKGKEMKIKIKHFSHNHQLTRCIQLSPKIMEKEIELPCMACKQNISGKLIYVCLSCTFVLHESCANNMPEQIQSSFHPVHPLLSQPLGRDSIVDCKVCEDKVFGISFCCNECNFNFHVSCAKYQTRPMKHNCHVHRLLLLGKSNIGRMNKYRKCNECGEYCKGAFFCCKNCDFYIHPECIPLPSVVQHIRHLHLLTLVDSVVEYDSGEYYCDICETERNPEHSVYFCEECTFIAHIDCVNSLVEPPQRVSSYLVPRPKKAKAGKGDQITGIRDDKLLEGEGIKHWKTEEGDDAETSMLNKIVDEIEESFKVMENLEKKLFELQKKRYKIRKVIDEKEGLEV